jgi:hypothetical protein
MLGDARETSGRRRLLVAGRLALPFAGRWRGQWGYSLAGAQRLGLYLSDPTAWTRPPTNLRA